MQTPLDIGRYLWLKVLHRFSARSGKPRVIRVRSLGGASVLCRPVRADIFTFKSTFLQRFHLPPVPLADHATIVDLGSNIGYTVAHLAQEYPSARVVGVEMDLRNLELARRNTAHLGDRVQLIHAAVWTQDGTVSYSGEQADAFQVCGSGGTGESMTAPAKTLSTLFHESGIERVDYLKMDIEGAEAAVLAGATDWLDRVRALKIEVHPPATIESCTRALESRGFRCWTDSHHWNCLCAVRA